MPSVLKTFKKSKRRAAEKTPLTPRRPQTAATSLKTQSLITRPIRALLRCSLPPNTVLFLVAGPRPSLRATTSRALPLMPAASPVWWKRTRQRPQRTTTQAWRVCHLLGHHTSETHSHTAPGWRTAPAPPVTPVAAAHQGLVNLSEGRALTSASNWNGHRIVSHHRTVSSTHLVVSWISIFSIPIKSQSLWEMRQVQVFATFSDGRRMRKKMRKMKEMNEAEEKEQVEPGRSAAQ